MINVSSVVTTLHGKTNCVDFALLTSEQLIDRFLLGDNVLDELSKRRIILDPMGDWDAAKKHRINVHGIIQSAFVLHRRLEDSKQVNFYQTLNQKKEIK